MRGDAPSAPICQLVAHAYKIPGVPIRDEIMNLFADRFARACEALSKCALALGLLLVSGCGSGADPEPAEPLNVLFISVDTLRPDHLGAYDYELPTSPNLDRFASQGTLFEVVFAHRGQTWPSLSSILTSRYPHSHGVRKNGISFPPEVRSIARVLQDEHGYDTAAFLTNMKKAQLPGFARMKGFGGKKKDIKATTAAIEWLDGQDGQSPFFLWVHYLSPHRTYDPPAKFEAMFARDYDGPIDGRDDDQLAGLTAERAQISYRPLRGRYDEGPSKGPSISRVPASLVSFPLLPASGCNRG